MLRDETDEEATATTAASTAASTAPPEGNDSKDESLGEDMATENMPRAPPEEPLFGGQGEYSGGRRLKSARRGDEPNNGRRAARSDSALWGENANDGEARRGDEPDDGQRAAPLDLALRGENAHDGEAVVASLQADVPSLHQTSNNCMQSGPAQEGSARRRNGVAGISSPQAEVPCPLADVNFPQTALESMRKERRSAPRGEDAAQQGKAGAVPPRH